MDITQYEAAQRIQAEMKSLQQDLETLMSATDLGALVDIRSRISDAEFMAFKTALESGLQAKIAQCQAEFDAL